MNDENEYIDKIVDSLSPSERCDFQNIVGDYVNALDKYRLDLERTNKISEISALGLNPNTLTNFELIKTLYEANFSKPKKKKFK